MADVIDVAEYILEKMGKISTWRLQKLVYYSQAWHLVWDGVPLFEERIEAWANGPVCPALYRTHSGQFGVSTVGGYSSNLAENERGTIDAVIKHYRKYNGQQLSDLTHSERPWILARDGVPPRERGNSEITHESMAEYYESL